MKAIRPNSLEAVMFFALYICAQYKKIAKEERQELILDIQVLRHLYFDIYGEYIDDDFKEIIESIHINEKTLNSFISETVGENEKNYFDKILTDSKLQDIAILAARHSASADGFHKLEKAKFNYWLQYWGL